jgi:hypothetical protein
MLLHSGAGRRCELGSELAFPIMTVWLVAGVITFLIALWLNKGKPNGAVKSIGWGCGCVIVMIFVFFAMPGLFFGLFV